MTFKRSLDVTNQRLLDVHDHIHKIQKQAFFVVEQTGTKENRNKKIDNSHTQFLLSQKSKKLCNLD